MNSGLWGMNGPYPPDLAVCALPNSFKRTQSINPRAGEPHLLLGPNATLASSPNKSSLAFVVSYLDVGNVQIVLGDSSQIGSDANYGFRYVMLGGAIAGAVPIIDSLSMGPLGNRGNLNLGAPNDANGKSLVGIGFPAATGQSAILAQCHVYFQDAATNTASVVSIADHATTGTPAAGFGGTFRMSLQDSAVVSVPAADITVSWTNATDGSQKARLVIGVWDTAVRNALQIDTDGSEAIITLPSNAVFQNTSGRARVTADVTNATATFSSLSNLSLTLVAGRKYTGRMAVKCVNSAAAEGIKFDFNGGSATMTNFWAGAGILASGGTDVIGANISTSLAGVINFTTFTGESVVVFDISLVCNVAGTFIPRFAENTSAVGTATVRLGSWLWLEDSPN